MRQNGPYTSTWRPRRWARLAAWMYVGAFGVALLMGAYLAVARGEFEVLAMVVIGGSFLLAVAVFGVLRPYIMATESGIEVRNGLRPRLIPWQDICEISPGYWGIGVETQKGAVAAWAVQKANVSVWFGRHTRADDVTRTLRDLVAAHHGLVDPASAHGGEVEQ